MKYMYSVANIYELNLYQDFVKRNKSKIEEYLLYLTECFDVQDMPEFIVLSNFEMATKVHKEIDLPAYTNDVRMVYTPDLEVWKGIYLKQFEVYHDASIADKGKRYYHQMNEHHILQILAHELAHQSELFLDDFDDENTGSIWFEEGMVEYISRKYFLTAEEFQKEKEFNEYLVDLFENKFGSKSIENFDYGTYDENITVIFYNYWRSFLAIHHLVEKFKSVEDVFASYHQWDHLGRKVTLAEWFEIE